MANCSTSLSLQYNCSESNKFQIDSMQRSRNLSNLTSYLDTYIATHLSSSCNTQFDDAQLFEFPHFSIAVHTLNKQLCVCFLSFFQITQILQNSETPEIAPIDHDPSLFQMTPLANGLISPQNIDFLEDFCLDSGNNCFNSMKAEPRKRSQRKEESKIFFGLQMFKLDSQLERIIEDEEGVQMSGSQDNSSWDEDSCEKEDLGNTLNSYVSSYEPLKCRSRGYSFRDNFEERQSTIDVSLVDYTQTIDRFSKNPKIDIIRKMREIQAMDNELQQAQKINLIRKHLEKYLLDYELHCFEESWKELNTDIKKVVARLTQGIEDTFSKKVGQLNFQNRRVKLLKYLEKKRRRIWRKKVSYDCRKKVADGRLRIKGKFVTREQACQQLGLESLDNYSADQIKQMLQRRIDQSLKNQQVIC